MSGADLLQSYLAELRAQLPAGLGWRARARILSEVEEHLLSASEAASAQGQPEALAVQQALERCGPPTAIAAGFAEVVNLRRVRSTRAGLLAAFAFCLGLVGLTFLRYPAITGSGTRAGFYLLVFAGILGGYAWVGLPTAQEATSQGALTLRQGTMIGLLAGVLGWCVGLGGKLALMALWSHSSPASATLWLDHRIEEATLALPFLVWCAGTLSGSVRAATLTGTSRTGLQIGLWSSIVYVLFSMVAGLALTHLLANTLAQTVWAHDAVCHATRDIATCAIGDDLGGSTNAFLVMPLLGIGLGWLGGKLGSPESRARAVNEQATEDTPRRLRAIPLFVAWSCGLFLLGLVGHWW